MRCGKSFNTELEAFSRVNFTGSMSVMNYVHRIFLCLVAFLPVVVWAQPSNTFSTSNSIGVGATNATYTWNELTFGPDTITIGDLGTCSIPAPPNPSCTLSGGSGTVADPYGYTCMPPLPLSQCSQSGTPYTVQDGDTHINTHTHRQTAAAVSEPGAATPVPLGLWVPIGSALGIGLLVLLWSRRLRKDGAI